MEQGLYPSPRRPLRVYGKALPLPVVESVVEIVSQTMKAETTPLPLQHVFTSDEEDDDMIEAFEYAAGQEDDSDYELDGESRDVAQHVLTKIEEEDSGSQGSLSVTGDDLGSQGTGSVTVSKVCMGPNSRRNRKPANMEKRRRRQEEVNKAVQQCRLKRKAMLSEMRGELEQLQATYKRLKLRSETLEENREWPVFEPKPYPPELESRRHTKRGTRYKAESEEERRERVRQQNNQAQYRKALRNKCDEDNMRNEIDFLKKTNATMRSFIHNHLKSKRILSSSHL